MHMLFYVPTVTLSVYNFSGSAISVITFHKITPQ